VQTDATAVRKQFLTRLREVASEGKLFDPGTTGATLGLRFNSSSQEVPLPFPDCRDGTKATSHVTTVSVAGSSWFQTLPSGAGHIPVPAFTINLATVSGDPAIDYKIFHMSGCPVSRRLRDHTGAALAFNGLPAFTCLTPPNIREVIPETRLMQATDGVYMMGVEGRVSDDSGTGLTFYFRVGAQCALYVDIGQDVEAGLRYGRALYRYETCREPSDRDFCVTHSNIGWANSEAIDEMDHQADRRCGTIDALYAQEPTTGLPPPPFTRRIRKEPCEGR
jgi:hypothetical protein